MQPGSWHTESEIAFVLRLGVGMHSGRKLDRLDVLTKYRSAVEGRERTPFDKAQVLAALDNLIIELQQKTHQDKSCRP